MPAIQQPTRPVVIHAAALFELHFLFLGCFLRLLFRGKLLQGDQFDEFFASTIELIAVLFLFFGRRGRGF
ncbi:hypothetical protein WT38_22250 [Burkholderia territorii]|nr:hypothetical protein WT38_22250 [Burkholderia territorii]